MRFFALIFCLGIISLHGFSHDIVSDVNVQINITHTWVSDLTLTLTSPSGTVVTLSTQNGASNTQDFSDTFITVITCTPPGTIWKRLIIKARIHSI